MSKRTTHETTVLDNTDSIIYLPDQAARIAELAYFKAESRGFEPGEELTDWLEAEAEYVF